MPIAKLPPVSAHLTFVILALASLTADAQYRGGRQDAPNRRPANGNELPEEFKDRLWYGAGGTLGFQSFNGSSIATVGLSPQIGYKINPWLSAGPRVGVTWTTFKGNTDLNNRQRSNTWDFTAGGFARGRYRAFYVQTEVSYLSNEYNFRNFSGALVTDPTTGKPETLRDDDLQWLIGVGYNPGSGGGTVSSDIGIFYNLFDDVESNTNPISFRIMLTFGY